MENVTLEIPSFDVPVFEEEEASVPPPPVKQKNEFKTELPVFEIPTFELDTAPKESAYKPVEAPVYKPVNIPPPQPAEIAPEEVIDLDSIDAQFGPSPTPEAYQEYDDPVFEDDDNIALTDDDGVRKKILVSGQSDDKPKKG